MKNAKTNLLGWLALFPVLVVFLTAAPSAFAKAKKEKTEKKSTTKTEKTEKTEAKGKTVTLPDGLKYDDVKVGTGNEAKSGDVVTVHYTGKLENGTVFDSSESHGQPFTFPLGAGQVIKGWDEGVAGMKEGGERNLTIPAALGYGATGAGGGKIPPNATLIFNVKLIKINKAR